MEAIKERKSKEVNENKRIFLSSPHMGNLEKEFIKEAFDTNWIAPLGPNVNSFEKEVAQYVGIDNAAALISGTSAIHLAIKLLGIKENFLYKLVDEGILFRFNICSNLQSNNL